MIWFRLKGSEPVTDVHTNEVNDNPKAGGSGLPLFALPQAFQGIAEQNARRAREQFEKAKEASEEISVLLKEAYAVNAKGAADYAAKVIDISHINASSALAFISELAGTRSLSEAIQLSADHGRKAFEVTTAQNKELWEIAKKVATETSEPIKKSFAKALKTPS
ncbi:MULTISPECIES: phasin family protein [Bradyrhizobium]|uniref:phasin family protein n=1 Tax=Bradyrhizobium TaxID=374 RepID=UPI0012D2E677|nr:MULTISPECIES: phasin family protein [Bradyrhizobium]